MTGSGLTTSTGFRRCLLGWCWRYWRSWRCWWCWRRFDRRRWCWRHRCAVLVGMRLGRLDLAGVRFLDVLVGVRGFRCRRYGAVPGWCSYWCWCWRWRRCRGLRESGACEQGSDQGGDDFLHDVILKMIYIVYIIIVTDPAFLYGRLLRRSWAKNAGALCAVDGLYNRLHSPGAAYTRLQAWPDSSKIVRFQVTESPCV